MNENKNVTTFIDNAIDNQQEILIILRELISKAVPNAEEQFKWNRPVYTTTKGFCYLDTTKKHATLGFFNFEKVQDSENLLEGTGKQMRHIKISKKEEIRHKLFSEMLQQAAKF